MGEGMIVPGAQVRVCALTLWARPAGPSCGGGAHTDPLLALQAGRRKYLDEPNDVPTPARPRPATQRKGATSLLTLA